MKNYNYNYEKLNLWWGASQTVANILEEKLKPISNIQNRTNESANSNSQPLSPASKRKAEQPISDNEIRDKEDANKVFGMHIFYY